MKKLITLLALAAVAIAPLFAGMKAPAMRNTGKAPLAKLDNNTSKAAGFAGTLDANVFDQSTNGYGWYQGHNKKIGYDTQSGIYGTIYRQKDASGSGALGGMVGTWGSNETSNLYKPTTDSGARYPDVTAKYGYIWSNWGDYISDNGAVADPYITIYSTSDEEWSSNIKMVDEGGSSAPGAWSSNGAVTKKPDGTYVYSVYWEVDGLGSGNRAIVTGTTTDPMDASSWTFTDYQDTYIKKGEGITGANGFAMAYGKDGFGIALTDGDVTGEGDYLLSYLITKNYGETWLMGEHNGFPSLKQVDFQTLFPNIFGQAVGGGTATITNIAMMWDFNVTIDDNNMVHVIAKIVGDDGTNGYAYTDAGTPIDGWWDLRGTLNAAGDDFEWSPSFIAQPYGWTNQTELEQFNGAPARIKCRGMASIGYAGNGVLYAGWLDRPENLADLVASPYKTDGKYDFILDGYVSMSPDNGNTWYHATEASGTVLAKGFNVTNTQPASGDTFGVNAVEEGWCVSDHAINDHNGGSGSGGAVTFYAVNQYADKDNHYPDPKDYYDHEQFLRIWKIDASDVGIHAEQVSLTKDFSLAQNYPNPFNPTTAISFKLKSEAKVNLAIFNANGEKVANLVNGKMGIGSHSVDFNASNLNSGVYFYSLTVNNRTETKKMVLTK